jgi:hypothetical protein
MLIAFLIYFFFWIYLAGTAGGGVGNGLRGIISLRSDVL